MRLRKGACSILSRQGDVIEDRGRIAGNNPAPLFPQSIGVQLWQG
jgi:hypothetical protein